MSSGTASTVYSDGNATYWDNYLKGRPKYTQDFFDLIFAYHESHHGGWKEAHDVGTGAGQAASFFASKFEQVIGSDMEPTQVEVAASRLTSYQNTRFVVSPAETLSKKFDAGSADLVAISEALPLMDAEKVVQVASMLLKPGGTFAAWYYGKPLFVSDTLDELDTACNAAYCNLVDAIYRDAVPLVCHMMSKEKFQTLMEHQASGLADVEIPSHQFADIQRHSWNGDVSSLSFVSSLPAIGLNDGWTSRIGEHECCTQAIDRKFWGEWWTIEDVKSYLKTGPPWLQVDSPAYSSMLAELERAMGGPAARQRVTWSMVLILGSRK